MDLQLPQLLKESVFHRLYPSAGHSLHSSGIHYACGTS